MPSNVSQLVQDFSGGSYFWVREILHFIKEHGAEAFTSAVGETDAFSPLPNENNTMLNFLRVKSPESSRPLSRRSSFDGEMENTVAGHNSSMYNVRASLYTSAHGSIRLRRGSSSRNVYHESGNITVTTTNKQLDHLLLIRFGNLQQEEQRVLRKASVIGLSFTTSCLYTLLSSHLQGHLSECLKTLVSQKWIYQDLTCDHTYQFVHGHVRQLVYELTPPSERNKLHQRTAEYILQLDPDDSAQFYNIWYHSQHYNCDLALQYAVRAVAVILRSGDMHDFMDCFDVLVNSVRCCKTTYDIYVLQHVTTQLHRKVEKLSILPPETSAHSWRNQIVSLIRFIGSVKFSTNRIWSYTYKQVVPQENDVAKDDISAAGGDIDDEVAKDIRIYKHKNTPATSNVSSVSEQDQQDTKHYLLEKIDTLRYQLSVKILELNTTGGCNEPREWQSAYLNISSCEII